MGVFFTYFNLNFYFLTEFETWKSALERETSAYFIKVKGSKCVWYYCNRSGTFAPRGKGIRHMKIQGTRKIGAKCPASMRVLQEKNSVKVKYWKTHVGHGNELKHINIPDQDRMEIASMLALGLPKNKILENIRASWSEEQYNRVHLTVNQDLINIARDKNIKCQVFRHSNDLISLESWIDEIKSTKNDPILCYDVDDGKNFILVLSTVGQKYLFEKYSDNIIAIDSTHGTNDYGFQLTTIMIVDENR